MSIDFIALTILLFLLLPLSYLKISIFKDQITPSLAFPRILDLKIPTRKTKWAAYPNKLHFAAFIFFAIAFIDPHLWLKRAVPLRPPSHSELPTKGIAIYLALDQSGSMAGEAKEVNGKRISKIDLLKNVTRQFIQDHPSDLIGLVSFARIPRVLVPLTLDQGVLLKELEKINVVQKPDEDGTGIGYAIFKTASLIAATRYFSEELRKEAAPPYTINGAAIIVVTDGFQDPSKLDLGNRLRTMELDDAANYVKKQNIHLYIVNIDPAFASPEYAPHRRLLEEITKETGGHFFMVEDSRNLQSIYKEVDRLEKGNISQEAAAQSPKGEDEKKSRFSFYPFFIGMGLLCLFLALWLESWVLKRIP